MKKIKLVVAQQIIISVLILTNAFSFYWVSERGKKINKAKVWEEGYCWGWNQAYNVDSKLEEPLEHNKKYLRSESCLAIGKEDEG